MQFIDLNVQQKRIREKIENNVKRVLDHGRYVLGPEVKELEERLANYVGTKHSIGVASGTDALLMILMSYGVGPGDAVFTTPFTFIATPFTFIATAEVIRLLGATPVFVDIDADTFNINSEKLEDKIIETQSTDLIPKGIISVDLFGQPADYDEIKHIAQKYDLFVLEDGAQSFGASYKSKKACSLADVSCTSFFPAKPLGAYGDAGMIFTDNIDIYKKLVSIRTHGQGSNKYENVRIGVNGRIDTMQAAILLAKFEIFDEEINLRQDVAKRYSEKLKDFVNVPYVKDFNVSAWAQYSVLYPERDKLLKKLKEKEIPSAIYYPKPLHLQEAFSNLGYKRGDFPVSEHVSETIFSLPFYPYLKLEDQERVVKAIVED
jgi:dTDP-4-amino-4,6-dideoxygalactose transaminase